MCQLRLMRSRCRVRIRNRGLLQWWPTGQLEKSARGTTVRRHHALSPARSIPGTVWPMRICWWSTWYHTCGQTTRNSYSMFWAVSPAKGSTQKQANDVVVISKQTGLRAGNPEVKLACSLLGLLQRGIDFQVAEPSSPHVTLSMPFLFPKCYLSSRLQTKLVFYLVDLPLDWGQLKGHVLPLICEFTGAPVSGFGTGGFTELTIKCLRVSLRWHK